MRELAIDRLRDVARNTAGLSLLLLYGSRARDDGHASSDWDVGYLGNAAIDHLSLLSAVVTALGTDDVDLVNLERASALLRFRAAREGIVIHESPPGAYHDFVMAAAVHWYEIEPVVRRTHRVLLAGLGQ